MKPCPFCDQPFNLDKLKNHIGKTHLGLTDLNELSRDDISKDQNELPVKAKGEERIVEDQNGSKCVLHWVKNIMIQSNLCPIFFQIILKRVEMEPNGN